MSHCDSSTRICVKMFNLMVDVQSVIQRQNVHGSNCHRGKMSPRTFQVGLNVMVDKTWLDVTSRHQLNQGRLFIFFLRTSSKYLSGPSSCFKYVKQLYFKNLFIFILGHPVVFFLIWEKAKQDFIIEKFRFSSGENYRGIHFGEKVIFLPLPF